MDRDWGNDAANLGLHCTCSMRENAIVPGRFAV
jgi:hypothetical protein